jgi:hypothetical protein
VANDEDSTQRRSGCKEKDSEFTTEVGFELERGILISLSTVEKPSLQISLFRMASTSKSGIEPPHSKLRFLGQVGVRGMEGGIQTFRFYLKVYLRW